MWRNTVTPFGLALALSTAVISPANAAFIPGRNFIVDEDSPKEGVLILSSTEFVSGVILPQFQPTLGFLIFCEGAATADETGCDPDPRAGQGISDVFQWYENDTRVNGQIVQQYFLRVFSDGADAGEPPEKSTLLDVPTTDGRMVSSCANLAGQCFAMPEPGHIKVQDNPPLFAELRPEMFEYTPADRELANKTHPGFISADPNRTYTLISDVPEPSSLFMAAAGACGMLIYGWRRRAAHRAVL
jgi:hypothetical protein